MYDLKAMAVFSTVIEQGTMQKAALKLNMTPAAVSQHISKLENFYKIKLINRTTRRLSLTAAGNGFYQGCLAMVEGAEKAISCLEELRDNPTGTLRISAPTGTVDSVLTLALETLLKENPDINVNIQYSDRYIDLYDNNIDIAIRAGEKILDEPNVIARHLKAVGLITCATPKYLAESGIPINHPDDLRKHKWIGALDVTQQPKTLAYTHENQEDTITIIQPLRIICDSYLISTRLTLQHLGISIRPECEIINKLKSGELVHILPDWHLPNINLYLITLNRADSTKVKLGIEAIKARFQQ